MFRPVQTFLTLLALLWLTSLGAAQTKTLYATDLEGVPKAIGVSPGFLTIIEFEQDIDQISSGRPDMVRVEASGAKVYVSALARSGSTDLVIEVGGRTQLFRVGVQAGSSTRRYLVLLDKPPKPVKPVQVKSKETQPVQVRPAAAKPVQAAPPAPAAGARPAPPPLPAAALSQLASDAPDPAAAPNPDWLDLRLSGGHAGPRPGEATLYFALNFAVGRAGPPGQLVISATDVRLSQAGGPVDAQVNQGPQVVTLRQGRTHLGSFTLRGVKPGLLLVSWRVSDPVAHRSYLVERSVDASAFVR